MQISNLAYIADDGNLCNEIQNVEPHADVLGSLCDRPTQLADKLLGI